MIVKYCCINIIASSSGRFVSAEPTAELVLFVFCVFVLLVCGYDKEKDHSYDVLYIIKTIAFILYICSRFPKVMRKKQPPTPK